MKYEGLRFETNVYIRVFIVTKEYIYFLGFSQND